MSQDRAPAHRWEAELQRAREELPLDELLRRCHRDELSPLARLLRVNPEGLGTGKLAQVCAWSLRRAGGHELANLLQRKGEGPGYPQVLRELALRHGVTPEPTLERTELALMDRWLHPPESDESAAAAKARLLAAGGALRVLPIFAPILAPAAMVAGALWLGRPKDEVLLPAVLEVARLRQVVRHRVTVGVVGSPSSGKDAAIKAVFGVDTGNVHPVAGSTREVAIMRLHDASALFLVNTPGMGDVVQAVTEEARQILHHIDVFLYVINAQGGVQARELADYRTCQAMGRPVLAVVNKIDTIRPSDQARYLADARARLGAPEEDFAAAAFDPLPQLSPRPIGVDLVQAWITHHLVELGKDPTELPWVPTELDSEVAPPGATWIEEPPVPDGPLVTPSPDAVPTLVPGGAAPERG